MTGGWLVCPTTGQDGVGRGKWGWGKKWVGDRESREIELNGLFEENEKEEGLFLVLKIAKIKFYINFLLL